MILRNNQKRQKKDIVPTSLELEIVNLETTIVEANEKKALVVAIKKKKSCFPFGFESNFNIDVMKCFLVLFQYVYWVKTLTHDLIKDTKFQEVLAILMPFDPNLQCPF